ncbi:MAG TPA: NifU family protein [Rhabdochlamydiaceae bacterium]|jgi:NifU-like protein
MSYPPFSLPLPWDRYTKKLAQKIENPRHAGFFSSEEATERGMRLAVGREANAHKTHIFYLYLLVDESDGIIADARFQVLGPSALIGAAEAVCEWLIRKTYDQAARLTAELIDKQVRDKAEIPAFPKEAFSCLNCVLDAISAAAEQCLDIPFAVNDVPTPLDPRSSGENSLYPGWKELPKEQKIAVVEYVIAQDIRPYIELDAGGIEIVDLGDDYSLTIAYHGACSSCHSATGSTLHAIQEILRAKVDPLIAVIPDSSFLKTHV